MLKTLPLLLLFVFSFALKADFPQDCPSGQEKWYTGQIECEWVMTPDGWDFQCTDMFECVAPWLLKSVPAMTPAVNPAFTSPKRSQATEARAFVAVALAPRHAIQVRMDDPALYPCSQCHTNDPPPPVQYGLCNDPEEPTPCQFSGVR